MNQVETLHEQNRTQAAEIQRLRDEIARLKGEQGKPDIKPSRRCKNLYVKIWLKSPIPQTVLAPESSSRNDPSATRCIRLASRSSHCNEEKPGKQRRVRA
jgi:hypothetical protein